jgi:hypothetical protein
MVLDVDFVMDENCKPPPVNTSDPDSQELARMAAKYLDLARFDNTIIKNADCIDHVSKHCLNFD